MFETAASANLSLKIRNLILMAPACTSELFYQEIVSHPERYKQFRMFTMDDAFEQSDHLLSVIYNRSLLYLISGILEPEEVDSPIAGMLRFATTALPFNFPILTPFSQFQFPCAHTH